MYMFRQLGILSKDSKHATYLVHDSSHKQFVIHNLNDLAIKITFTKLGSDNDMLNKLNSIYLYG